MRGRSGRIATQRHLLKWVLFEARPAHVAFGTKRGSLRWSSTETILLVGPKAAVIKYENALEARFEIKRRGHIGESEGCVKEIRILNRVLRLTPEGLRYKAGPRHAEFLIRA